MLEKLVFLCKTFGSGSLATGCHIPAVSLVPHRLRSLCTLGPLWLSKKVEIGTVSGALSAVVTTPLWPMKAIPQKFKAKKFSTKIGKNDGRMEEGGSTN